MADSKVNGKVIGRPAGYDSFSKGKALGTAELKHGEREEGFQTPSYESIVIPIREIAAAVKAYKENGEPLPSNLTVIKVQNTQQIER